MIPTVMQSEKFNKDSCFFKKANFMTRYLFYFGNLGRHVGLYKSWATAVTPRINLDLLTTVSPLIWLRRRREINELYKENAKVMVIPDFLEKYVMTLYFLTLAVIHRKLVVHVKKKNTDPIIMARKLLPNKVRLVIDIEGDVAVQNEYIARNKDEQTRVALKKSGEYFNKLQAKNIYDADGIKVVTNELLSLIACRHKLSTEQQKKFCILPTGYSAHRFYFDKEIRERYRKQLSVEDKDVFIFVGDVTYEWQNVGSVIRTFSNILKNRKDLNPFLILAILDSSKFIAQGFLERYSIPIERYLLQQLPNDEVNGHLNAADFAILYRDDHLMNRVSSPGKLGEYLGSGVQVVTTPYIGTYSSVLIECGIGIIIENFRDDDEVVKKVKKRITDKERMRISRFANARFSSDALASKYVDFLESL
jgi:hypothetical protein